MTTEKDYAAIMINLFYYGGLQSKLAADTIQDLLSQLNGYKEQSIVHAKCIADMKAEIGRLKKELESTKNHFDPS